MEPLPIVVREGSMLRAGAIGIAAAGLGVFVLLTCWGISLFNHNGLADRIEDALKQRTDALVAVIRDTAKPDRTDEVLTKLDSVVASLRSRIDDYNASSMSSISRQLDIIQSQIYDLKSKSPIIVPPKAKEEDPKIIQTEVTVFKSVEHEGGRVHTGWTYPNGGSADSPPRLQFCYWSTQPVGDTTAVIDVWIAVDGKQLANIPPNIPNLSGALDKCIWWGGGTTQRIESSRPKQPRYQPLGQGWRNP
jgi:hypothetical protein